MVEEEANQEPHGGVTLGHLLMVTGFMMPIVAVIGDVKHADGGVLRYVVGVPLALILGILVILSNWHLRRLIWTRTRAYAVAAQNRVAFGVLLLDIGWIVVGGIAGSRLASLIIRHLRP